MAGWNTTDFDWEDLSTLYNAPPGLLLADLLAAATERWNVLNNAEISHPSIGDNGPLIIQDYHNLFANLVSGSDRDNRFTMPVSGSSYDYTNESDIPGWSMFELINELGPYPANGYQDIIIIPPYPPDYHPNPPIVITGYHSNAPVTAEWCQWWYHAINKLVRVMYDPSGGGILATCLTSMKTYESLASITWSEAKAAWNALPWGAQTSSYGRATQEARAAGAGWFIRRRRSITDQATAQWKPHRYLGNYTLTAWVRFGDSGQIYENPDYPCDEDTFAKIWDDASVQSQVYNKDIEFGYFDNITLSEPDSTERGYYGFAAYGGNHCRFDISGGFEFVAP